MLHFLKAGSEQVRWELTSIESGRSYRLAVHHSHGVIVEYFKTAALAIVRVQELENLLVRGREFDDLTPAGLPS